MARERDERDERGRRGGKDLTIRNERVMSLASLGFGLEKERKSEAGRGRRSSREEEEEERGGRDGGGGSLRTSNRDEA